MKLSELITNLQAVQARTETDPEVTLDVHDYYTRRFGSVATFKVDASASVQGGYFVNGEYLTITANLQPDYDGKYPKVTFRK